MNRPYDFKAGPWENSTLPTITRDDPNGGDPHILAVIARVHDGDALHALCDLANDAHQARAHQEAAAEMYEALLLAERLHRDGILGVPDGFWDQVHAARRSALAKAESAQ